MSSKAVDGCRLTVDHLVIMSQSLYITVREASQTLGISEGKIMQMIDSKKLQAYKIAGQYLRLKRADVLGLKDSGKVASENIKYPYSPQEKLQDFFAYNDFYIAALIVIAGLLSAIFFIK